MAASPEPLAGLQPGLSVSQSTSHEGTSVKSSKLSPSGFRRYPEPKLLTKDLCPPVGAQNRALVWPQHQSADGRSRAVIPPGPDCAARRSAGHGRVAAAAPGWHWPWACGCSSPRGALAVGMWLQLPPGGIQAVAVWLQLAPGDVPLCALHDSRKLAGWSGFRNFGFAVHRVTLAPWSENTRRVGQTTEGLEVQGSAPHTHPRVSPQRLKHVTH